MAKIALEERSVLARNIVLRRKRLKWSQDMLAHKAGFHINIIKKIESGKGEGELGTREAIAGALGCTLSDLYKDGLTSKTDTSPIESYERAKQALSAPDGKFGVEFGLEVLQRLLDADPRHRAMVISFLYNEPSLANILPKPQNLSKAR